MALKVTTRARKLTNGFLIEPGMSLDISQFLPLTPSPLMEVKL